ncbi:hypothetical protein NL676_014114 [Syzygium grande]|nr:hypothetical protein NL676_014114 [Syzygium grande]
MLSEGDDGSPAKCCERRRRRIEMQRLSSVSATGPSPQPGPGPGGSRAWGSSPCASGAKRIHASDGSCCLLPSSSSSGDDVEAPPLPLHPTAVVVAATLVECYGAVSVSGRLREMEDIAKENCLQVGHEDCELSHLSMHWTQHPWWHFGRIWIRSLVANSERQIMHSTTNQATSIPLSSSRSGRSSRPLSSPRCWLA